MHLSSVYDVGFDMRNLCLEFFLPRVALFHLWFTAFIQNTCKSLFNSKAVAINATKQWATSLGEDMNHIYTLLTPVMAVKLSLFIIWYSSYKSPHMYQTKHYEVTPKVTIWRNVSSLHVYDTQLKVQVSQASVI